VFIIVVLGESRSMSPLVRAAICMYFTFNFHP